ncbi:hypothetical protein ACOMHN_050878 [Nucella lapillus]
MAVYRGKHRETWPFTEEDTGKHGCLQRKTWLFAEEDMAVCTGRHGCLQRKTWPFTEENMAVYRGRHGCLQILGNGKGSGKFRNIDKALNL